MKNELKLSKDLDPNITKDNYFKPAGDLASNSFSGNNKETDEDFLFRITSGISYRNKKDEVSEYTVVAGGKMVTTIDRVREMVDEGCNIIKSSIIGNVNNNLLVEIEFEKLVKKEKQNLSK